MDCETNYCDLCKLSFTSDEEFKEHQWSVLHHRKLDQEKGRDAIHKCELCNDVNFGLLAFTKHIHSECHQDQLSEWKCNNKSNSSLAANIRSSSLYPINNKTFTGYADKYRWRRADYVTNKIPLMSRLPVTNSCNTMDSPQNGLAPQRFFNVRTNHTLESSAVSSIREAKEYSDMKRKHSLLENANKVILDFHKIPMLPQRSEQFNKRLNISKHSTGDSSTCPTTTKESNKEGPSMVDYENGLINNQTLVKHHHRDGMSSQKSQLMSTKRANVSEDPQNFCNKKRKIVANTDHAEEMSALSSLLGAQSTDDEHRNSFSHSTQFSPEAGKYKLNDRLQSVLKRSQAVVSRYSKHRDLSKQKRDERMKKTIAQNQTNQQSCVQQSDSERFSGYNSSNSTIDFQTQTSANRQQATYNKRQPPTLHNGHLSGKTLELLQMTKKVTIPVYNIQTYLQKYSNNSSSNDALEKVYKLIITVDKTLIFQLNNLGAGGQKQISNTPLNKISETQKKKKKKKKQSLQRNRGQPSPPKQHAEKHMQLSGEQTPKNALKNKKSLAQSNGSSTKNVSPGKIFMKKEVNKQLAFITHEAKTNEIPEDVTDTLPLFQVESPPINISSKCKFKKNDGQFCNAKTVQKFCDYHKRVVDAVELYIKQKVATNNSDVADAVSLIESPCKMDVSSIKSKKIEDVSDSVFPGARKRSFSQGSEASSASESPSKNVDFSRFKDFDARRQRSNSTCLSSDNSDSNTVEGAPYQKRNIKVGRFKYLKTLTGRAPEIDKAKLPVNVRKFLDRKLQNLSDLTNQECTSPGETIDTEDRSNVFPVKYAPTHVFDTPHTRTDSPFSPTVILDKSISLSFLKDLNNYSTDSSMSSGSCQGMVKDAIMINALFKLPSSPIMKEKSFSKVKNRCMTNPISVLNTTSTLKTEPTVKCSSVVIGSTAASSSGTGTNCTISSMESEFNTKYENSTFSVGITSAVNSSASISTVSDVRSRDTVNSGLHSMAILPVKNFKSNSTLTTTCASDISSECVIDLSSQLAAVATTLSSKKSILRNLTTVSSTIVKDTISFACNTSSTSITTLNSFSDILRKHTSSVPEVSTYSSTPNASIHTLPVRKETIENLSQILKHSGRSNQVVSSTSSKSSITVASKYAENKLSNSEKIVITSEKTSIESLLNAQDENVEILLEPDRKDTSNNDPPIAHQKSVWPPGEATQSIDKEEILRNLDDVKSKLNNLRKLVSKYETLEATFINLLADNKNTKNKSTVSEAVLSKTLDKNLSCVCSSFNESFDTCQSSQYQTPPSTINNSEQTMDHTVPSIVNNSENSGVFDGKSKKDNLACGKDRKINDDSVINDSLNCADIQLEKSKVVMKINPTEAVTHMKISHGYLFVATNAPSLIACNVEDCWKLHRVDLDWLQSFTCFEVAFKHGKKMLYVGSKVGCIVGLSFHSWKVVQKFFFKQHSMVSCMHYTSEVIFAGFTDGFYVQVYPETNECSEMFKTYGVKRRGITCIESFTKSGTTQMCFGTKHGCIYIIDMRGTLLHTLSMAEKNICVVHINIIDEKLYAVTRNKTIYVYDCCRNFKELQHFDTTLALPLASTLISSVSSTLYSIQAKLNSTHGKKAVIAATNMKNAKETAEVYVCAKDSSLTCLCASNNEAQHIIYFANNKGEIRMFTSSRVSLPSKRPVESIAVSEQAIPQQTQEYCEYCHVTLPRDKLNKHQQKYLCLICKTCSSYRRRKWK